MNFILHGKAIGWLVMKKDSELPWATRILRWTLVAGAITGLLLATVYGIMRVIYCAKLWFF